MKLAKYLFLTLSVSSPLTYALPERTDVLIAALISNDSFRGLTQTNSQKEALSFDALKINQVHNWSEDLLRLCGMDKGYSRSSSILQVSYSLTREDTNKTQTETKYVYFSTPNKGQDLALCNSK